MGMIDDVRRCVRALASRTAPWPPLPRVLDLSAEYRYLRTLIDATPSSAVPPSDPWSRARLTRFAEWFVPQALLAEVSSVRLVFEAALRILITGQTDHGLTPSDAAELSDIMGAGRFDEDPHWRVSVLYAEKVGLIRAGVVTPYGQLFDSLPDKDARRWLLTLEMHQSLGFDDEWRVCLGHVRVLINHPSGEWHGHDAELEEFWPSERLASLGYVSLSDLGTPSYDVAEPELAELKATVDASNPMWSVASALANDPAHLLLSAGLESPQELGMRSASRAAAEFGRTAAHELRNVLLPVDASVNLLADALRGTDAGSAALPSLGELHEQIKRLWRYADWFGQLGESLGRPPERFGARAALEEAVQRANGGRIRTSLDVPAATTLFGLRDRFVLALLNLLRNAQQAGAGRIELAASVTPDALLVTVDDDGPGVPPDRVPQLFVSTFTTRDQGQGEGLSLVRRVLEGDHLGAIGYTRSPLGGARFSVRVPL